MKYWLGPWQWKRAGGPLWSWNPPAGMVGSVDLRTNATAGLPGATGERPYGFFFGGDEVELPSEYTLLGTGDCRELPTTTAMQSAWQSLLSYRPAGERLVDLLWDQLTDGADAGGEESVAPLAPRANGSAQLVLAGHSVVKQTRFADRLVRGGRWASVLTARLRRSFARHFRASPEVAEKWLGAMAAKYRLGANWKHLVPPNLRAHTRGPRRPTTALADLFDRSNENLNVGSWTYNSSQDYEVYNNGVRNVLSSGYRPAQHTTPLSSDDHWSEIEWERSPVNYGPAVRLRNATTTTPSLYYLQRFTDVYVSKVISGSQSNLANASAGSTASGDVDRLLADGSVLEAYINGSLRVDVTDTSLEGDLLVGFLIFADANVVYRRWAGEDILAGGGGGTTYYHPTQSLPSIRTGGCEL